MQVNIELFMNITCQGTKAKDNKYGTSNSSFYNATVFYCFKSSETKTLLRSGTEWFSGTVYSERFPETPQRSLVHFSFIVLLNFLQGQSI